MKSAPLLLALLALGAGAPAMAERLSPITRVVELLQGMAKKIEEEAKHEEDLYETFVCWAKTVIDSKTASNEAAQTRSDELKQYIDDLANGRIELTSERTDLEKELSQLNADIEEAQALRKQEHEDFLEAKKEMSQAIAALEKAGAVLAEATEGHATGSLLAFKEGLHEGFKARAMEAASLDRAVSIGKKFLSRGDALFLQRLLTGDVPVVDWKKLNRKATFKMSYKARSFKIQDILAKLLATFKDSLDEAEKKEASAQEEYDKLMESKVAQKDAAEEALSKMDVENGARAMSKSDAQDEVDALATQMENDKKFIEQTTTALAEKKQEWKDRSALRKGELAAISKAIEILHSDDSRDLFKKSLASQGLLLQVSEHTASRSRAAFGAAEAIRRVARRSKDLRLGAIAALAEQAGGHFDKVIEAIDKMVATLKAEMDQDLKDKEMCEKDRHEDSRAASLASRSIDEMSDAISKLKAEIQEILSEIADKEAEIKRITEELAEATRIREDEHAAWLENDADDKAASELVQQARDVLANFYTENGLALIQQPEVVAGEAPPPPPTTWEAPYSGKQDVSTGIVAILEMIKEDIDADRAKAKAAEDEAQAAFDTFKSESETQLSELAAEIEKLQGLKGEKEEAVKTTTEERAATKGELDAVMQKLKDSAVGCDYIAVNFAVRTKNREIEMDGLTKAKAILQGAAFGEAPDPNREIKPGDALFLAQRK